MNEGWHEVLFTFPFPPTSVVWSPLNCCHFTSFIRQPFYRRIASASHRKFSRQITTIIFRNVLQFWSLLELTLSVFRIFVHSVSCHFLVKNPATQFFSVKLQHSLLDFYHLTSFFQDDLDYWFFYDFKPNFLLEAGQILERSQWIQIL